MNIKFYLRKQANKNHIEFTIHKNFIDIIDDKKVYKRIKKSTGIELNSKHWNEKTQSVRDSQNSVEINAKINEIRNYLNEIEKEYHEKNKVLSLVILKEKIDIFFNGIEKQEVLNFKKFMIFIIENHESVSFKRTLKQTFRVLMEFAEKEKYRIDYDNINLNFQSYFSNYLNKQLFSINTHAKHISNIKYFMNESYKRKLHDNIDFKNFKVKKERIENIYLNDNEINKIFNLDLKTNPRLDKAKDLFLIGCYTGLRFSDFIKIIPENITNNVLSIKTQKTGKYVKIPMRKEIIQILDKYKGFMPKVVSNQKLNEYIKEIGILAGINEKVLKYKSKGTDIEQTIKRKYELICTHTARRSFATNCYKVGIPAKQIMLITGHTTESEFFKYIQINESENAEMLLNHSYFQNELRIVS